jgi:LCP family protein required for cell wall assembly
MSAMSDMNRSSGTPSSKRRAAAGGSVPETPTPIGPLGARGTDHRPGRAESPDRLSIWPDDDPFASRNPEEQPGSEEQPPKRHRWRRRFLIGSLVGVALLLIAAGGTFWWLNSFTGKIDRIPGVFSSIPEEERPAKPAEGEPGHGALTFLLAGTDRRSDVPTTGESAQADEFVPGAQRTDSIMLMHLTDDRSKAYVISIPRDSWVEIPGHGHNKINAAYSFGGPSLYVRTIERLTGIRVDHLALIDWSGFKELTDAVGGVDVTIPDTVYDSARDKTWTAGTHHLDGDEALEYVRQRHGLPGGDFDRVKRQQNYLRAVMSEALSQGTITNPIRLRRLLDAVTKTVSVDDTLSNSDLRGLAFSLRNLHTNDVTFLTVPTRGTGFEGRASVVYVDEERADALWKAVKSDDLPTFLKMHGKPSEQLGADVG